MGGFLKEVTGFRSDFRELLDTKVDHILGMIADMQQQLQAHEWANEKEIKFDGCVPEIHFEQQTVIPATDCEESEIVMPCSLAEFESRSEKLELMHEHHCTTVEEADFSTDETTKMQAQKVFDEMLESEMKVLCVTKTETVEMKTEIGESEVQPQRFARSFDSLQRVTCAQYLHIWANENHFSRVLNNRARVRWKEEPPGHLEYLCEAYYLKPFNLNVSLPLSSRIPHFLDHDSPSVFDVKTLMSSHDNMLMRTHERNCCLTYDYVTDEDAATYSTTVQTTILCGTGKKGIGVLMFDQLMSKLLPQFRRLSRGDTTHSRGEYCYGNGVGQEGGFDGGKGRHWCDSEVAIQDWIDYGESGGSDVCGSEHVMRLGFGIFPTSFKSQDGYISVKINNIGHYIHVALGITHLVLVLVEDLLVRIDVEPLGCFVVGYNDRSTFAETSFPISTFESWGHDSSRGEYCCENGAWRKGGVCGDEFDY